MFEWYGIHPEIRRLRYTRTPETSWDRILESDIKLMTDYPGIFNYLRYTQQCEFIEELKKSDTYNRELEYNKSDRYVDISSLGKYKLSDMQKERINREYKERKQFDIINYACDLEDASYLNRVNIDILNGKCTADEKLNISGTIGNLLNECMEICIVDLNKSIYGHSSNELNRYLKQYPKKIWITGGITSVAEAEALIQNGAKGVVIGSTIYREGKIDVSMVESFINRLSSEKVYFSVDYLGENIVTRGFEETTIIKLDDVLQMFEKRKRNVNVILVDVNASKNQLKVDFEKIMKIINEYKHIRFYYGGNLAEFAQVRRLNNLGIGAILGKNYLKGEFE